MGVRIWRCMGLMWWAWHGWRGGATSTRKPAERAYTVGRQADRPDAEAVFLSGTGMPTLAMLQVLEDDLGKPVISASSAMMWNTLRIAGVSSLGPATGACSPEHADRQGVRARSSGIDACQRGDIEPIRKFV